MQTLEEIQKSVTQQYANAQQLAAHWQAQVLRYEGALALIAAQIEEAAAEKVRQELGAQYRETLGNEITAYANAAGVTPEAAA